jgi:GntR family transcriptional regulator
MDLQLDPASAVPIYAQIVEQVRALVATRALRPGDKLPSVRELAAGLRVNRNTAAKAYHALESDGVVETRAGQGCFIADGGPRWSRAERYRRIDRSVDRTLVEAHHLEIPLEELPDIVGRRIENFSQRPTGRSDRS